MEHQHNHVEKNTRDRCILCCTELCFRQKICLIFPNRNWNIERSCKSDSKTVSTLVILSRMEKCRKKSSKPKKTISGLSSYKLAVLFSPFSLFNMSQLCTCHSTVWLSVCRVFLLRHLPNQFVEAQCSFFSLCLHRGRHDRCIWSNAKNYIVDVKYTNLGSQVSIVRNP